MDSNKDFARSKRRATQRHKPGRGGYDTRRSTAKAELGTNEERYVLLAEHTVCGSSFQQLPLMWIILHADIKKTASLPLQLVAMWLSHGHRVQT